MRQRSARLFVFMLSALILSACTLPAASPRVEFGEGDAVIITPIRQTLVDAHLWLLGATSDTLTCAPEDNLQVCSIPAPLEAGSEYRTRVQLTPGASTFGCWLTGYVAEGLRPDDWRAVPCASP